MWPVVLGGAALVGVLLKSKPDTDDEEVSSRTPDKRKAGKADDTAAKAVSLAPPPVSPIAGVSVDKWLEFRSKLEDMNHVGKDSPPGLLGIYRFSIPRLSDLGLCSNVRKDGKLWVGAFFPPLTRDKFAGHVGLQRRAFELSCGDLVTRIRADYGRDIGREVDGEKATLSGLVAVSHRAGFKGLKNWLTRADDRKRFPHTTAAFRAANGVF